MKTLVFLCVDKIVDNIIYNAKIKTESELPLSCSEITHHNLIIRNIQLILNNYLKVLPLQIYILIEKILIKNI